MPTAKFPSRVVAHIVALLVVAFAASLTCADEQDEVAAESPSTYTFKFVDQAGGPVAGATVGNFAYWDNGQPAQFYLNQHEESTTSTDDGSLTLSLADLEAELAEGPARLIAMAADKKLGCLFTLAKEDLAEAKTVELQPLCHVHGKMHSTALDELGQQLTWTGCYVYAGEDRPYFSMSKQGELELLLPPGDYRLSAYGSALVGKQAQEITIEPAQVELEVDIDLPTTRLAQLIGKPAPELEHVAAWKGTPIKLADLRGRVVLLDFWGYWCGPCVQLMPELSALYERLEGRGLSVVAVHDSSVATVAELDEQLESIKEELWNGKDLPFPIAIDQNPSEETSGLDAAAHGVTTATYGIRSWPTAIAIDRQGNVIGAVSYHGERGAQEIEALLDAAATPAE